MKRQPIAAHLGMTRREFIRAKKLLALKALRVFCDPDANGPADDLITGAAYMPDYVAEQVNAAHRAMSLAYQYLRSERC